MNSTPRPAVILVAIALGSCIPVAPAPLATQSLGSPQAVSTPPSPAPSVTMAAESPTLPWNVLLDYIEATIVAKESPQVIDFDPSPDGKWLAEVLAYECMPVSLGEESISALEALRVTDAHSGEAKVVERQVSNCGGIGAAGLSGISWSRNSRFFYFTNAAEGMPEGCGWWVAPTRRLDVTTWSIEDLGSGPLSPDGSMRAAWQGSELLVSSLESAEITRFKPLVTAATHGQIAWSPTGSSLVYLQTEFDCYPWGNTFLVRVDLTLSTSDLLVESESPSFAWVDWSVPNRLDLRDQDDIQWAFDLVTDTLVKTR